MCLRSVVISNFTDVWWKYSNFKLSLNKLFDGDIFHEVMNVKIRSMELAELFKIRVGLVILISCRIKM